MAGKPKQETATVDIVQLSTRTIEVNLVGITPFICNAMSAKVRQTLLLPPKKKNRAEKESTLKHEPYDEYRSSPYYSKDADAPTRIICTAGSVKQAMANAALDIPGARKTEIGRLSWIVERDIPLFGVPQIFCSVTRNSDMARTPDLRTRAIIPEWAMRLSVQFVAPNLNETAVANLLAAAGLVCGLGDWRQQKGKGNHGQFRLTAHDDPELLRIMKTGGRDAQEAALSDPTPFDIETEELLEWFDAERRRRGFEAA